ncbi:hypothetical protein KQI84_18415 [bacterium]|nr:hypothetical protein [bacterium]
MKWRTRHESDRTTSAIEFLDHLHEHPPLDHVSVCTVPYVTTFEQSIGDMMAVDREVARERIREYYTQFGMEPPDITDDDFEVPDYRF